MGTQQLLLIVLGVVAVSVAVLAGLSYFAGQAVESNRDQVIANLNTLANMAQAYFKKEKNLGGGGSSFAGFDIPENLKENAAGTFELLNATSTRALIEGVGVEDSGTSGGGCSESTQKITYQISVTASETSLKKIY